MLRSAHDLTVAHCALRIQALIKQRARRFRLLPPRVPMAGSKAVGSDIPA